MINTRRGKMCAVAQDYVMTRSPDLDRFGAGYTLSILKAVMLDIKTYVYYTFMFDYQ